MASWWLLLIACTKTEPDAPDFPVTPGVETATVTGVAPGDPLTLYDADGAELITLLADLNGQANFAYVPASPLTVDTRDGVRFPVQDGRVLSPGTYEIRNEDADLSSGPFEVLAVDDVPEAAFYDQPLDGIPYSPLGGDLDDPNDGFQYVQARDGTWLSVMVRFPDPALYGEGPWPTVVEYSGYAPSDPGSPDPGSRIANALGYATVGVNMRGTGCSGGVFDLFNRAQHADGYDVIEIVARQPWVKDGRVGMVGLSYPGISQLFVASTNPPSLAAIVPSSVIADPWEMQWPGGIYNEGFTRTWVEEREAESGVGATSWVNARIDAGDERCRENTALSTQNIDFEPFLRGLANRPPDADDRNLVDLVRQIEAPVHLLGAWQDEQTGALFGDMLDRFDSSADARFVLYNGRHVDGYAPDAVSRWFEFLEFHVAGRIPRLHPAIRSFGASSFAAEFGMTDYTFAPDRFPQDQPFEDALAAYLAEPPVHLRLEVGAADGELPGAPRARTTASFAVWPPPQATPIDWALAASGLSASPADAGARSWTFDGDAGAVNFFGPRGYELMAPIWDLDWTRFDAEHSAVWDSAPFDADAVLAGPGVAELWIESPVDDLDVQVTLSELRPDGVEVLIQSGWLRASHRAVASQDGLRLRRAYNAASRASMPLDTAARVDVAIPSFAHPMRTGSRLRMTVSNPGRNHGTWQFEPLTYENTPEFAVVFGADTPSALRLSVLPEIEVPPGLPACPSLRGQPCRPFEE